MSLGAGCRRGGAAPGGAPRFAAPPGDARAAAGSDVQLAARPGDARAPESLTAKAPPRSAATTSQPAARPPVLTAVWPDTVGMRPAVPCRFNAPTGPGGALQTIESQAALLRFFRGELACVQTLERIAGGPVDFTSTRLVAATLAGGERVRLEERARAFALIAQAQWTGAEPEDQGPRLYFVPASGKPVQLERRAAPPLPRGVAPPP
ncbi:MAG: hypothetical protein R3A51_01225 [Nannocystaceae bacterium]